MLRELSEDMRIRVKDGLRDLRSIVRNRRHDNASPAPQSAEAKKFPIREIEGFLGHAASAFDDVMTLTEQLAPQRGAADRASGPKPLQSYFPKAGEIDGERAFRRDLYHLVKLALVEQRLGDFRMREIDLASVHGALEKSEAGAIAELQVEFDAEERRMLVARLTAALFLQLRRQAPIRLPDGAVERGDVAVNVFAAIAIACGLATLDMEGAPAAELMEIAVLAVEARGDRIRAAANDKDARNELTLLFAGLLAHLN